MIDIHIFTKVKSVDQRSADHDRIAVKCEHGFNVPLDVRQRPYGTSVGVQEGLLLQERIERTHRTARAARKHRSGVELNRRDGQVIVDVYRMVCPLVPDVARRRPFLSGQAFIDIDRAFAPRGVRCICASEDDDIRPSVAGYVGNDRVFVLGKREAVAYGVISCQHIDKITPLKVENMQPVFVAIDQFHIPVLIEVEHRQGGRARAVGSGMGSDSLQLTVHQFKGMKPLAGGDAYFGYTVVIDVAHKGDGWPVSEESGRMRVARLYKVS